MIECARCGYRNDAAAKFCAACGAPMLTAQGLPAQSPMQLAQGQPIAGSMQPGMQPGYAAPAWGAPAMPQPPPNWGPQHWGAPAPQPAAAQWGPPAPPPPAAQQAAPPHAAAAPYPAPPPWGAPAPEPVAPAWGQPSWGRDGSPLAPVAPEPLPVAAAVVPTAASAVIAPLDADQIPANAPRTLAAFLVTFDADPLGQFWPIQQGQNLVGRKGSGAELNLEIDHPTTSSRHAMVHAAARPGRIKVEDLGSTNGTYVNERRLEPGERRSIEPGDSLRFGGFSVTVILV